MPGIYGVASRRSDPDATRLEAMAARMKHYPWYAESQHIDDAAGVSLGRIALGFINPNAQPAFNEDRSVAVMMDGEVYDCAEQRQALVVRGSVFHGDSQAELLAHGYT